MMLLDQDIPFGPVANFAAYDMFVPVLNHCGSFASAEDVSAGINWVRQNVINCPVLGCPPLNRSLVGFMDQSR
jgi:hypothetical protein